MGAFNDCQQNTSKSMSFTANERIRFLTVVMDV